MMDFRCSFFVGKTFLKVEAHLVAEDGYCAGACTVAFLCAFDEDAVE